MLALSWLFSLLLLLLLVALSHGYGEDDNGGGGNNWGDWDPCNFNGYGVTGNVVSTHEGVDSASDCRDLCAEAGGDGGCVFFDLDQSTSTCTLKDGNSAFTSTEDDSHVSGPGNCSAYSERNKYTTCLVFVCMDKWKPQNSCRPHLACPDLRSRHGRVFLAGELEVEVLLPAEHHRLQLLLHHGLHGLRPGLPGGGAVRQVVG